jgi:hypothetical protein
MPPGGTNSSRYASHPVHSHKPAVQYASRTPAEGNPSASTDNGAANGNAVHLIGLDEAHLQALLGPPTVQEDRAPGKTWKYRNGRCTLNLSLYPDVETRVFHTLSYEVTSDDHTDEGKRLCMVELQSWAHNR